MKSTRLFLLFALIALAGSALAIEPLKISETTETEVYLKADTIRRNGDEVSFFLIFNLKKDSVYNGEKFKSFTSFIYGNCKNKTGDQGAQVAYKGPLGTGKMIFANQGEPRDTFNVPPKLVNNYVAGVCNKETDPK